MKVATYEATVENGQIKISQPVHLPEHARVYVVVPGVEEVPAFVVASPRLARPEQARDFVKEIIEDGTDAALS
jgi:predicted DNA-binding antitoxin AbrB/MazE fold protein